MNFEIMISGDFRAYFRTSRCMRTLLLRLHRHLSAVADVATVAVASSFSRHGYGHGNGFYERTSYLSHVTGFKPFVACNVRIRWAVAIGLIYALHSDWLVFAVFYVGRACLIVAFWLARGLEPFDCQRRWTIWLAKGLEPVELSSSIGQVNRAVWLVIGVECSYWPGQPCLMIGWWSNVICLPVFDVQCSPEACSFGVIKCSS